MRQRESQSLQEEEKFTYSKFEVRFSSKLQSSHLHQEKVKQTVFLVIAYLAYLAKRF
jgi:hypothetical protein